MKTKQSLFFIIFSLICVSFLFDSCNKKEEDKPEINGEAAAQNAFAESLFDDIYKNTTDGMTSEENELKNGAGSKLRDKTNYPVLSLTPWNLVTWPKTLIIDYGTTNHLCEDGKYRRGVLTAIASGFYRDSNTVITIAPTDFYVNDYKIEGGKELKNLGHNNSGHLVFTVKVTNGVITYPDGTTKQTWSSVRQNEWVQGESTYFNILDDIYNITGSANGITKDGVSYVYNIIEPLEVAIGCKWVRKGKLTLDIDNGTPTITADYGNGTCDNKATVSAAGYTVDVVMN